MQQPILRERLETAEHLHLDDVRKDGPFSASDVASARLTNRLPEWFDQDARVDHRLLGNISAAVSRLTAHGLVGVAERPRRKQLAEFLMGEILFVSYLEHREIVGPIYRKRRRVGQLLDLVAENDRQGVQRLIECLRSDFNGDFLGEDSHDPWVALTDRGYQLLHQFLRHTDLQTGQGQFWNYDFSYIPVELLSGLYEMFLSPRDQAKQGAFYTPRHLAALAVDEVFRRSQDPLCETIFDGACGSGILLTTAYRRLLALAEERARRPLSFVDRCELLQRSIFGADINPMACRVTAFSLYLSVFEGLDPADILEAQERDEAKLPSLKKGPNLAAGPEIGDFFSEAHALAGQRFSLVISNPPWTQPAREERTSADKWLQRTKQPCPRRQVAGAYALRALDFLDQGGLVSLILPMALLHGHSSAAFISHLLRLYRPFRVMNFGDLQELIFPTARHGCHLFTGQRRADDPKATDFHEAFDYCVPKADLTLALGHLTMQSADLHRLHTASVSEDPNSSCRVCGAMPMTSHSGRGWLFAGLLPISSSRRVLPTNALFGRASIWWTAAERQFPQPLSGV